MRCVTRFSMLALGLAMLVGLSSNLAVRADDAPTTPPAKATGTVSGKVVDAKGNAAKGVTVNAMPGEAPAGGRQRGGARPKPLATATTGDDGTYKLDAVPAGTVRIVARSKEAGVGMAADVVVTAGNDTKVDDIQLAQRQNNRRGGGNGGGGAKN